MNHKMTDQQLSDLLQPADSSDQVEQLEDGFPELVFRSPAIQETFGNTTFVILIVAFGLPLVLLGVLATLAGHQSMVVGLFVVVVLALIGLVSILLLRRGRVVLKSDKLIEYNFLNHPRCLTYAQIFEVKQGAHADQTWIRYYSMDRNGRINTRSIRGRNLIAVHGETELRRELSRRISAPEPMLSQNAGSMLMVLLLGVLVIPVVVAVFYLFAVAIKR